LARIEILWNKIWSSEEPRLGYRRLR